MKTCEQLMKTIQRCTRPFVFRLSFVHRLAGAGCLSALGAAALLLPASQATPVPAGLSPADWASIQQQMRPIPTNRIPERAYLKASNTEAFDEFGSSVAVSGDTVVVGAPEEGFFLGSGAAYVFVRSGGVWIQQAYLKASNTEVNDDFGFSVAVSGDTVVVGAPSEDSNATGVNGNESDNSALTAGAAYVFVRSGTTWTQQAYLKASNTGFFDEFGISVAVSGDTVVVGARVEASNATGINGDQSDNSAIFAGAAYVFVREGTTWSQQAYLKASNTERHDFFGNSVGVWGDTVVVGAVREDSNATRVNGNQGDNSATDSGAAYVFVREGTTWSQQAFLKASNTESGEFGDQFGFSVAVSGDTVVVGAPQEDSSATGVNGNQSDNSAFASGAAYVFVRKGTTWSQEAYLKASNTEAGDIFGLSVAVSGDTVVVGARSEDSNATGVNGNESDNSAWTAGAAYVFVRSGTTWTQQAYLKASNTGTGDLFGTSVAVSGDTVVVGAPQEDSNATGVNGTGTDPDDMFNSGAAYVFTGLGPPDSDGDGVLDADDECLNTPAGALTDAAGCSIEQLAPCDAPWRNHGEYVRALHEVISYFVREGLLNEREGHEVFKQGATSDCGKK